MSHDLKLALGAGALYAAAEVYLGDRYPLRDPFPLPARMAVAGGLAVLCVMVAAQFVDDRRTT